MHELTHRGMRRTLAQGEGDGTPPTGRHRRTLQAACGTPAVTHLPPCNSTVGRGHEVSAPRSEEG